MKQLTKVQNPDVSVVMSCYNASRFLPEAIASVLEQSFHNFEFILIDDGSTDETWDIIQHYRHIDERIVSISKNNTGLADSLNVGIALARGAWIARLDADDLCEPTRLTAQMEYVCNHPDVVLLGTGFIEIDENGRDIKKHQYPSNHRRLVRHLERLQRFFPHSSAIFKRVTTQETGCYNPLFKKTQDWDLWLRFMERGRISCLEDCLVKVRKHTSQISNSTSGVPQIVYGIVASTCHFLRVNGYPDPSVGNNEAIWCELTTWVEKRITEEGVFEMRELWAEARTEYLANENRLVGGFKFSTHLLKSGYAESLLWEKFFGLSLPKRLVQEWIRRPCAV